jgi:hypothetical protein
MSQSQAHNSFLFRSENAALKTKKYCGNPPLLNHEQRLREAILLSFREGFPHRLDSLCSLSHSGWQRLLDWLDISGLALYFLDRIVQLGLRDALPETTIRRLEQNARDNAQRTHGMANESVTIQYAFQEAGVSYAVMKGLSLWPVSVPRPELRHQFDLDFLVSASSASAARNILELRGYRLFAMGGKSWEFKINETPYVSVKDLYKDNPYRAVELHLEHDTAAVSSRLDRVVHEEKFGMNMPVFSPVDLFTGQAMHAFKDVCSAFSRAAHLLEFYRHVMHRRDDAMFWHDLHARVGEDRRICVGIGVVTYLLGNIMGDFAPRALTIWTVDALPPSARLWVDLYGRRVVFGKHPGTKLYLLLQKELEAAGLPGKRSVGKSLMPSRLPPAVVRSVSSGESLQTRMARYRIQTRVVLSRARFHIVEGIRYAAESYRWRQHLERLSS